MVSAYSIQGKINEALNMAGEKFEDCRREGQHHAADRWNRIANDLARLSNLCMRESMAEEAGGPIVKDSMLRDEKAIEDLAYRAPEMLPQPQGDLP